MTHKKATSRKSPIAMDTALALWRALRKNRTVRASACKVRGADTAPASPPWIALALGMEPGSLLPASPLVSRGCWHESRVCSSDPQLFPCFPPLGWQVPNSSDQCPISYPETSRRPSQTRLITCLSSRRVRGARTPARLHEQPSGHCPPHFSRSHFCSSQGLGWMQKLYWCHQHVATLLQTPRLHQYNHMSNCSTHCQARRLSLSPAGGSQSSDTSHLHMSPFSFPSLGNFTAHLHPGHGSDPSLHYSSFMHYNAPDWSQEPRHIISAPFTHGCMLWESLGPALSPSGLSWGHSKCSV